jgi:DNA polymerase
MDASDFIPAGTHSLPKLREAALHCRGCDLYRRATQTVFGEGTRRARMILVGEQPGDQEDLSGRPFVGPAGRLLSQVLAELHVDRKAVYVTNAVKHFKWTPRGKRRLHSKPSSREVNACRPWFAAEVEAIQPDVIVCLGATAAQSLLGRAFRLTKHRGEFVESDWAPHLLATYHPSAILRAPDEESRHRMRGEFVDDMRLASEVIGSTATSG